MGAVGHLFVSEAGRYRRDPESYGFFNGYGHSYGRADGSCGVCRTIGAGAAWRTELEMSSLLSVQLLLSENTR